MVVSVQGWFLQLYQEDPEVFRGQLRDVVLPAGPGSSSGSSLGPGLGSGCVGGIQNRTRSGPQAPVEGWVRG